MGGRLPPAQTAQRAKNLPPECAVKIAIGTAEALDYIHKHRVIHRDLKQENIMIDADDNIKRSTSALPPTPARAA
jgi:serine/threonine protein kinase